MKNTLFLLLFAVVLFLAIYFYWGKSKTESQLAVADEKITSLEEQVHRFTRKGPVDTIAPLAPTQPRVDLSADEAPTPPESTTFEEEIGELSESDIERLQRKGLKNPEADLMNDLMRKQKTLLATKGTMGGTMAIQDIRILNDRYALASFEDGHNSGNMLLRYTVNNGTITWTRLDSYTM